MKRGHTKEDVDRVLSTVREAMRSLIARTTTIADNEHRVVSTMLQRTYLGWDQADIPANVSQIMRDISITRDRRVDGETYQIVDTFETVERWVKDATGYDEEEDCDGEEGEEGEPAELPMPSEKPVLPDAKRKKQFNSKAIGKKIMDVLHRSSEARNLDELISACCSEERVDRERFVMAVRTLQESGDLVEVELDTYQAGGQA